MKKKGQDYFTKRIFYTMFWPSLFSTLILSIGNIIDALVVGVRMSEIGLAAISLVTPIFMIFNVFDIAISVGGSVTFSRLLGEGRIKEAVRNFNQMFLTSMVLSLVIAVLGSIAIQPLLKLLGTLPQDGELYRMTHTYAKILIAAAPLYFINFLFYYYIRSDDGARLASFGFAFGNIVDIILSSIFVLFFDWGVSGAIWGSVIGKACSILIYLPHFFQKNSILRIQLVVPDFKHILSVFQTGFSSSSQYAFQFISLTALNHMLMRVGQEQAVAVFNVVTNVSYVVLAVYEGTASTLQTLSATFYGEKNKRAQTYCKKLSFRWGSGSGILGAFLVAVLADSVCRIFGLTESLSWGSNAVRAFAAGSALAGISMMQASYFQSVMEEKITLLIGFLRSFVVYLPCAFFFSYLPRAYFFWFLPVTEVISLAVWQGVVYQKQITKRQQNGKTIEKERVLRIDLSLGQAESASFEPKQENLLRSSQEKLGKALETIGTFTEKWKATGKQNYYVRMAVEEICSTIISEGLKEDPDGCLELTLIALADGDFEIHIRDSAKRFNPFEKKTGKALSREFDIETIGILMVKEKAKEFSYRTLQGFNTIVIRV